MERAEENASHTVEVLFKADVLVHPREQLRNAVEGAAVHHKVGADKRQHGIRQSVNPLFGGGQDVSLEVLARQRQDVGVAEQACKMLAVQEQLEPSCVLGSVLRGIQHIDHGGQ